MIHLYAVAVPRSRPPGRLQQVVSAATRVFAEKGYTRTQMVDIAREARLSAGALYGYAESKDALFHWCIEAAADRDVLTGVELPLPAVEWAVTAARRRAHLEALRTGNSALRTALRTRHTDDVEAELAGIIGEIYDRTFASRRLQAIVERSALDIPELYDAFFANMRRPVIETLTKY